MLSLLPPELRPSMDPRLNTPQRRSGYAQRLRRQRRRDAPPQAEDSVGRNEADDEKDGADQRIESIGADEIDGEGFQEDIERGPEKRPDRVADAANDRDDQDADGLADADRARRNTAVEPDAEHAGHTGDEARQEAARGTERRHILPNGARPPAAV